MPNFERLLLSEICLGHEASEIHNGLSLFQPLRSTISLPGKFNDTTLHTDGLFMLFEILDPVTSTCLGLTCKKFWAAHKVFHKKPLSMDSSSYYFGPRPKLHELLGNWMGTGMEYV